MIAVAAPWQAGSDAMHRPVQEAGAIHVLTKRSANWKYSEVIVNPIPKHGGSLGCEMAMVGSSLYLNYVDADMYHLRGRYIGQQLREALVSHMRVCRVDLVLGL